MELSFNPTTDMNTSLWCASYRGNYFYWTSHHRCNVMAVEMAIKHAGALVNNALSSSKYVAYRIRIYDVLICSHVWMDVSSLLTCSLPQKSRLLMYLCHSKVI